MELYLIVCMCQLLCITAGVIVQTQYGQVRGKSMVVSNTRAVKMVDVFRGIPFAKETSGPRRFTSPVEVDPWVGVLEAEEHGDMCPQDPIGTLSVTNPEWQRYSEDCLHLDVVSPNVTGGPYPVMVWIHGGGYYQGGNIQFPGHFLAMFDVVVAVINYRLGNLGFAFTGNDACPGNAGLWDQKMGLEFVVNNIASFGGDPNQITVFGQSAGAASVSLLMMSPQTKGLFHGAILQSGAEKNYWTIHDPESNPANYTYQAAKSLGCGDEADDEAMMDCLREKDWSLLVYNVSITCTPGYYCAGQTPTVDGFNGFLPKTPAELRRDGDIMRGPIISGINKDDGSIALPYYVPGTVLGCCNRTEFQQALRDTYLGPYSPRFDEVTEENIYQAMDWRYSPWPYIYDNESNREALVKLTTDTMFGHAWDQQLKDHQNVAPSYGYMYNYRSELSPFPEWMGVTHADEMWHIWGYSMRDFNEEIFNDSYIDVNITYDADDIQHSLLLQELWTNFAKFGDPTPVPVEDPRGGSGVWPRFNTEELTVLHLSKLNNSTTEFIHGYEQDKYAFWTEYMDYLALGIPSDG